ncbi:MAG: DUF1592 domain-containing protein [Acidobacteria bacterium]|nr:DUF1592 domain-containing protein [Acidobacteriota bacterium]
MGAVRFDVFADQATALKEPALWETTVQKVRSGEMPPRGQPRPTLKSIRAVTDWIESQLDQLSTKARPDPGRVTARRLNRVEYNNTVRDLTGLDLRPADDFPADDSGYGFDNIGDVLSLSPLLMEKYMAAASKIIRAAVVDVPVVNPAREKYIAPRIHEGEDPKPGMEVTPLGGFHVTADFPYVAQYRVQVRIQARRYHPNYSEKGSPLPPPVPMVVSVDGKPLKTFEIEYSYSQGSFDVTFEATAGEHVVSAEFLIQDNEPLRVNIPQCPCHGEMALFVDYFEIEGPFDPKLAPLPESHKRILVCGHHKGQHQPGCAQEVLSKLATKAYRRPVTQEEIDDLKRFVDLAQKKGDSFEQGIRLAMKAILVSPHFLFRIEQGQDPHDDSEALHKVSQYELASRLSYFLWSSMPDEELFEAAVNFKLRDPRVLRRQTQRMLEDPKSKALVENFAGQWLQLRNLDRTTPDPEVFPNFDNELRSAMRRETELFFETVMREDRSVLDFLDGKFTFLNARLARHYGIQRVDGAEFRRVDLDGTQRSGVLTHASILTISSYPTRTSPVLRGKWLLENILGAAPPPPPPGVPELDTKEAGITATLRAKLEQHRANPNCAVCHEKMDALGFGLENYNAIGEWRTHDGKFEIDSSGELAEGLTFSRPSELKVALKSEKDDFVRCLTEKMLIYALGRGLERYDKPVVDHIVSRLAEDDYRFSRLIEEIVNSMPFQMRGGDGDKQ